MGLILPFATAVADLERFEPELDGVWDSTYGTIHWDSGWYGQENHTIKITGAKWVESKRAYVVSGNWGRVTSKTYKGGFQFEFVSPIKFEGWWTQDGADGQNGWSGTLRGKHAPAAPVEPDEFIKPAPPKPGALDDIAKAEFVPDLKKVWSSSYGEIHWEEGYYGNQEKTLKVVEHGWDSVGKKYVVRGIWGRKSSKDSYGLFEFVFSDIHSFTGHWGGAELPLPYGWSGSLEEQ